MSETQKIQLVQDQRKIVLDAVVGVVSLGILYLSVHPEKATEIQEAIERYRQRVVYHFSVWATRNDIRSLPETQERQ